MSRTWKKYHNSNKTPFDCQLVTAVNAYYYLTGKTIPQDSEKYDELVELTGCAHGAAISIEKAWDKLGIKVLQESGTLFDFRVNRSKKDKKKPSPPDFTFKKSCPLPIEWRIWHKNTGFHSTLIVEECKKVKAFRVLNFRDVTTNGGWLFEEDMYMYSRGIPCQNNVCFKLFGLKGKK